jgi:hypothetical protein
MYGADASDVARFLLGLDLDEEYQTKKISKLGDEYLAELFRSKFGGELHRWDNVCWFHLTRVPANTDFAEGILPLHLALEKVWGTLISILSDARRRANLEKLRGAGVDDFQYNLKTGDTSLSGPYAMLVRESAFQSRSMGNHDYLKLPEIIEDICNGYQRQFGESIIEGVSIALKPCIVKFEVAEGDVSDLVEAVLMYCWSKVHSQELSLDANTCYDAGGTIVPHSAIRKIEFV